jgi:hypothetical protein
VILLLANKWDLTVDLVVLELRSRGVPFVRLNTEDLPRLAATVQLPSARAVVSTADGQLLSFADVTAVWNRRPGRAYDDTPPENRPSEATQKFVVEQWLAWLEVLELQPHVRWVNHPVANALMENKLRQLRLASELGFLVPDTIVTNDGEAVRQWIAGLDSRVICKALYAPLIEEATEDQFIFTSMLDSLPDDFDVSLKAAPVIFQQALLPKVDYRVSVVGEQLFCARIEPSEAVLDWRTAGSDVSFKAWQLPPGIERRCRDFLQAAGLAFGAIDLIESAGAFYFIEINPNGEWGWLQRPHGFPIAAALCDLLTDEQRK